MDAADRIPVAQDVYVRPHHWHFVRTGIEPEVLFLHGTAASSHSWHGILSKLSATYGCLALDLPGHGETRLGSRFRSGINQMAQDIGKLLTDQGWRPRAIIAHSAGAAIALRLSASMDNIPVVGINPAIQPFQGVTALAFPMMARAMTSVPMVISSAAHVLSEQSRVNALLDSTGSNIGKESRTAYEKLFRKKSHLEGVLLMMAQWKLDGLLADLPKLTMPCLFLTGSGDRTVPPISAVETAQAMPNARVLSFDGYGHLMHEEAPEVVADVAARWIDTVADNPQIGACEDMFERT